MGGGAGESVEASHIASLIPRAANNQRDLISDKVKSKGNTRAVL